ncbi:MAG: class I SAM-dependent methyltransferase [Thermodesulfobacteriota bacterium]
MPKWDDDAPIVDVACPFCDQGARRRIVDTVWDSPDAAVYQCSGCELVFIYPIMTLEEEKAFYEAEFSKYMKQRGATGETVPAEHFVGNQPEAQRRLKNLGPYLKPDMHVLEIGSSTGFMLAAIQPRVASVTGVEPNLLYADYARGKGLTTYPTLADVENGQYDLILAYYVLEHLRDPVKYLKTLHSLLRLGGILALEVPNVDDALVRFYQVESFDRFYWQRAHYCYYSHRTLKEVLTRAGFESVEMIPEHRYDFSNHIHWILTGQPGGKGKYAHLFDKDLDAQYARCLKDHWLCDTVFAVANR